MNNLATKITPVNIEEELQRSYLDYAMSVIVGRALPDIRDGLKPVHRRVLFAMSILGNDWNKAYKKSARIVGDVIGKYHPHGDSAVYDTIVRMAQPFSLRYMLIDGQGNFGSVDGDSPAAMRYTEIRMSKIAHELLVDLEKETVNFVPNYDNTEQIPEVMPTRIPNLLVNGSAGIAVGMATNIPPHNLYEIINGCLAYIKDENISIEGLMKHIKGPDFPTAAIINGRQGIIEAYHTGRGKIYLRAQAKVETDIKIKRETIIVSEIPYQVNKARLLEKIAELVKDKRIEGISALRDESDKDGLRIVIEVKRDATGEVVLNNLYSLTQLQVTFGINMVALYKNQPRLLNLKDILREFIHHRREVVTRRTLFELRKARNRAHILEALAIALVSINTIIELIRIAKNSTEAKDSLMKQSWQLGNLTKVLEQTKDNAIYPEILENNHNIHKGQYYFSEQQAQAILDLRLHKLTSIEHEKLINEYEDLLKKISELILILANSEKLLKVIYEELIKIKDEYTDKRRTKITDNIIDINVKDLINQEDVVVTLSHQGYIKYQPLNDYQAQRRGGKGKTAARIKEEDFIDQLLIADTHDTILCFSSRGRLHWIKVYQLPETSRNARGRPIVNLLRLKENERITTILPVQAYEAKRHVFMATACGIVKKSILTDFCNPRKDGINIINLKEDDELIAVALTDGNDEVMLFATSGKMVRFPEERVRSMGRSATGVRGMKLKYNDRLVSLIIPSGEGQILTITENGFGKCTPSDKYLIKSGRGNEGVRSIKVSKRNGKLVGAIQVMASDQVIIITNTGTLVRIRVAEISIVGRQAQGVTLIRTKENEHVVGLQRVTEQNNKIFNNKDNT